jgi:hypothetical protein
MKGRHGQDDSKKHERRHQDCDDFEYNRVIGACRNVVQHPTPQLQCQVGPLDTCTYTESNGPSSSDCPPVRIPKEGRLNHCRARP